MSKHVGKSDSNLHDQRTEQNRIDTPADTFGVGLSSDFMKTDAPLTDASDKPDHRFHRPAQVSGPDDSSVSPTNLPDESAGVRPANTPRKTPPEPQTDR